MKEIFKDLPTAISSGRVGDNDLWHSHLPSWASHLLFRPLQGDVFFAFLAAIEALTTDLETLSVSSALSIAS